MRDNECSQGGASLPARRTIVVHVTIRTAPDQLPLMKQLARSRDSLASQDIRARGCGRRLDERP
jgi:hypothetical protein